MCTVTFIPTAGKIYLTSNRDEKFWRKQALPPRFYFHNNAQLIYPKDEDAGGSWIAVNNNGNAGVLLNGSFVKHVSLPPYIKSRGIIFLDILKAQSPVNYFSNIDLTGIEPFTLVLFEKNNLYECRWNGYKKYSKQLSSHKPYIWSSATLYNEEVVNKREEWFTNWLEKNIAPNQDEILKFHQFGGDGDKHTDILMNLENKVNTVSITSIEFNKESGKMNYLDLKNNEMYFAKMKFENLSTTEYKYNGKKNFVSSVLY